MKLIKIRLLSNKISRKIIFSIRRKLLFLDGGLICSEWLLTKEIINSYKNANTDEKKSILRNAVQKILKSYSWGMPDKISKELNAKFAQ